MPQSGHLDLMSEWPRGLKTAPWYADNNTRLRIRLSSSSDLTDSGQVLNYLTFNFLSHFSCSTGILLNNADKGSGNVKPYTHLILNTPIKGIPPKLGQYRQGQEEQVYS